jgi:hypothetical protein
MGVGYKGWRGRQRLYSKDSSLTTFDWLDDLKKYRKWVVLLAFIVLGSLYEAHARISYDFPYDDITMDIVKVDHTGGGTYQCPTLQLCYIKVLEAEARGATQYCESITIKKDGVIIWQRFYQLRGSQ